MRGRIKTTHIVLALLCVMYFITYVDRVNIGTAATGIKHDLGLSNTELGLVFSAYAYPYLIFQVIGGWVGDKFGPRRTLFWCGIIWAAATILVGFVNGLWTLFAARILLGLGEGATFPTATRAMQDWTPGAKRGFAQGLTHACARLGNAVTPPLIAFLMITTSWRGAFIVVGIGSLVWVAVWLWYFRDKPSEHKGITEDELRSLPAPSGPRPPVPWRPLVRAMWPVTLTYFCYGWTLWLYLNWIPLFFKTNYHLDIAKSALFASGVFFAGVIGDTAGGVLSDTIFKRTGKLRFARLCVTTAGFSGAFLSLLPIFFTHDITMVSLCLSAGFFFAELVIGPMWSIPMDIAPKYSGTAAGLMNSGSAFAAIVSPIVAGAVIDMTGNWYLPFLMSMALLLTGALAGFLMHPERPFEGKVRSPAAEPAPAE